MQKLIDPICGMKVAPPALQVKGHDDIAFCSTMCREAFLADPARYVRFEESTRRPELSASEPMGEVEEAK